MSAERAKRRSRAAARSGYRFTLPARLFGRPRDLCASRLFTNGKKHRTFATVRWLSPLARGSAGASWGWSLFVFRWPFFAPPRVLERTGRAPFRCSRSTHAPRAARQGRTSDLEEKAVLFAPRCLSSFVLFALFFSRAPAAPCAAVADGSRKAQGADARAACRTARRAARRARAVVMAANGCCVCVTFTVPARKKQNAQTNHTPLAVGSPSRGLVCSPFLEYGSSD